MEVDYSFLSPSITASEAPQIHMWQVKYHQVARGHLPLSTPPISDRS